MIADCWRRIASAIMGPDRIALLRTDLPVRRRLSIGPAVWPQPDDIALLNRARVLDQQIIWDRSHRTGWVLLHAPGGQSTPPTSVRAGAIRPLYATAMLSPNATSLRRTPNQSFARGRASGVLLALVSD